LNSRKFTSLFWLSLCIIAFMVAVIPLVSIIFYVAVKGVAALNLSLLTNLPASPGVRGGGIGNAIQGSLILVGLASCIGIPIGIFAGVYMSENSGDRISSVARFLQNILVGIPSIVTGIFIYTLVVIPLQRFSTIAGAIALGTMMVPIVSSATLEAMKSVPHSIREASLALGIRTWRTTVLVMSNAKKSIATGVLLSIARITGETAPLLLTALGSTLWFSGLNQPVSSLTLQIYNYATSPFPDWQAQAWAASLVLMLVVMSLNIAVRLMTRGKWSYAEQ
jgi:phosphate transport system permease protein